MISRRTVVAVLAVASLQGEGVHADPPQALVIAEGHLFFSVRRNTLYMLADIWPNKSTVEAVSPAERANLLTSTAVAAAKTILAKPNMDGVEAVRVEFTYVKNMDEYARQDFSSMVRHGYLMFDRKGTELVLKSNGLKFEPSS